MLSAPRFSQLNDWLAWLEKLHPQAIDLGLSRVYRVAKTLDLLQSPTDISHSHSGSLSSQVPVKVITVAGTNGKGSCVKTIEQCLLSQNYSVGTYTSPHLHHYCERICINGEPVDEQWVCDAFAAIDQARGDISLTYFEFGTLAALWIFVQQKVPHILLEVGLGGRLDAVNIVDADLSIITSIAIDHEEWLGRDRNLIAHEKLGVARKRRPVVIAETGLTPSLIAFAESHALSQIIHRHFFLEAGGIKEKIYWRPSAESSAIQLDRPKLPLNSVFAGLQALYILDLLPPAECLSHVLSSLSLSGRYETQIINGVEVVFDVAHNPAAASLLAKQLAEDKGRVNNVAVFSVMADKDIKQIIEPLSDSFSCWYYAQLEDNDRAASIDQLTDVFTASDIQDTIAFGSITQAFEQALNDVGEHGRIVVFGSFFAVAAIQRYIG